MMILRQKARNQFLFLVLKLKHDCSYRAKKLALTFCYAVFGLSKVNDDIIEAQIRVLESAGNYI